MPFFLRAGIAVPLAILLAGCETTKGSQLVESGRNDLASVAVCCTTLAQASHQPLPVSQADGLLLVMDRSRQVFEFDGSKAFFVSFALPAFQMPYSIEISSLPQGTLQDSALLHPRVATYDADFKRLRYFDEKTLRMRGQQLERTVFINANDAAERYLVIYGNDLDARQETIYAVISTTPVTSGPVMFNMVSGSDVKGILRTSPTGIVRITVKDPSTAHKTGK